jgi:heptosyltransferase III
LDAWVAGKQRIGLLAPERKQRWKQRWKQRLLSQTVEFDNRNTHTVLMNLKLATALGIAPSYAVIASWTPQDAAQLATIFIPPLPQGARGFGALNLEPWDAQPYAVLHVYPKFAYKTWHVQGWVDLAQWLTTRGLRVLLTGSKDPDELAYVEQICKQLPPDTINLAGRLSLSQSACLLSRAKVYVGPDTVMTHIAAAVGAPTVALFGPSNPVKWGPWPQGYAQPQNPYRLRGTQRVENVILLQGSGDCVPCMEEGCERNIRSLSACLQNLSSQEVIAALQSLRVGV